MKKLLAILIVVIALVTASVIAWAKCTYTLKDTVYPDYENCNNDPLGSTSSQGKIGHNKAEDYLKRIKDNPCLKDSTTCKVKPVAKKKPSKRQY